MRVALSVDRIGYRSLPIIVVDNLSFSYESGQNRAGDGLSFAVEQGEIFGFLGPSGAGKSTTQKILIRLLRQYDGSVSVFDHNLKDWGPEY